MNIRKPLTLALIVLGVSGGVAFAGSKHCSSGYGESSGEYSHHRGHMSLTHMVEKLDRKLDLTEAQSAQVEQIVAGVRDDMKSMKSDMKELRLAMLKLDPASESYDAKVTELSEKAAEMARSRVLMHSEVQRDVLAILTPEQQQELGEMMEKKMHKMESRMKDHQSS